MKNRFQPSCPVLSLFGGFVLPTLALALSPTVASAGTCIPGPAYANCMKEQKAVGNLENTMHASLQNARIAPAHSSIAPSPAPLPAPAKPLPVTGYPSPYGSAVPQGPAHGPVQVVFRGLESPVPGHAFVTATMGAQNSCPPACTFNYTNFPVGFTAAISAQADSQSILRGFTGCVGGGPSDSTAPEAPGNSGSCGLPNPQLATTVTVLVDPASPAQVSPPYAGTYPPKSPPAGITLAQNSGSAFGPGSCTSMNSFVTATTRLNSDSVVVGFLTNRSSQVLYVNFAFTRGGIVDTATAGAVTVRPGQTVGGEGGGVWASTAGPNAVDSNPPGIRYSAWPQSEENQGRNCKVNW